MSDSFIDLARKRCSTRKYTRNPVGREILDRCLEAARLAPSACNSQPWSFVVADCEPIRGRLGQAAFSGIYSSNAFAAMAPVLIVVVAGRSSSLATLGGWMRSVPYSLIDIGIACEHLVLQAAAEGVGTCWLGWFNEAAVRKVLDLPRAAHAPIVISMGYPADEGAREKRRKPLDEIRRYAG